MLFPKKRSHCPRVKRAEASSRVFCGFPLKRQLSSQASPLSLQQKKAPTVPSTGSPLVLAGSMVWWYTQCVICK